MGMAEILQKVSRSEKSICPKCFHNHVCLAIDNQPCFECNQFVEVVRCGNCVKRPKNIEWAMCHVLCRQTHKDDFCPYGERKDNV